MKHSQSGASHLVFILVLALITTLLAFGILGFTYLQVKLSSRVTNTQNAYYSAEAIMVDTYQLLMSNPGIFDSIDPNQPLFHDNATIYRQVFKETDADGNEYYRIVVNATVQGVQRQLEGTFGAGGSQSVVTSSGPLDIMLVLDTSQSMKDHEETDQDGNPTRAYIEMAKASQEFVNYLFDNSPNSQIGLVHFNTYSQMLNQLGDSRSQILSNLDISNIENIVGGGTNTASGINQAIQELNSDRSRDGIKKVMIVFSDGQPNGAVDNTCDYSCLHTFCFEEFCTTNFSSPYACDVEDYKDHTKPYEAYPESNPYGTCCSQNAIELSNQAKNQDTDLFSISYSKFLTLSTDPIYACRIPSADQVMLLISSEHPQNPNADIFDTDLTYFKKANEAYELSNLFQEIAETITSPSYFNFTYREVEPDFVPSIPSP